jgi:hypothetical protein
MRALAGRTARERGVRRRRAASWPRSMSGETRRCGRCGASTTRNTPAPKGVRFNADIVAKVENRTSLKISRRLIFGPGSLRFTARQNKPMLSENWPTLYCVPERFWLIVFTNERCRRGAGWLRLRSMARQLPQKNTGTDAPRRLPTERRGAFFFCVKAFLLRQSFSFASKEGVYEHHSQENLAEL